MQERSSGAQFIGLKTALVESSAGAAARQASPPLHDALGLGDGKPCQPKLGLQNCEKTQRTHCGFAEGVARVPSTLAIEHQPKANPLHRVFIPCRSVTVKSIR